MSDIFWNVLGGGMIGYVGGYLVARFPIAGRLVGYFLVGMAFVSDDGLNLGPMPVNETGATSWWPILGLVAGFFIGVWHFHKEQEEKERANV